MLLLPVVFMLHEYEEIIMFRHWLDRNRDELKYSTNNDSWLLLLSDFQKHMRSISWIPLPTTYTERQGLLCQIISDKGEIRQRKGLFRTKVVFYSISCV